MGRRWQREPPGLKFCKMPCVIPCKYGLERFSTSTLEMYFSVPGKMVSAIGQHTLAAGPGQLTPGSQRRVQMEGLLGTPRSGVQVP